MKSFGKSGSLDLVEGESLACRSSTSPTPNASCHSAVSRRPNCFLDDFILAEFAVFALSLKIAGRVLWPEYAGDYLSAVALGVVFQ